MKKWTYLVSLCTLLIGYQTKAQDKVAELPVEQILPYFTKSKKSIIERTASFESYSTLLSVLKATNLDQVLGYNGEFTIFAPSNLAFEKLSKITTDKLLDPKNKKVLKTILSHHIIAGKLSASSILRAMCRGNGSANFTTIQGEKIIATMKGIEIILTDKSGNQAIIVRADSNQSNGVIHEIDTVFLPINIF
ncbi:fasciclin domain-containing protein [Maribacter sp. ACAM166]|uniref:fasciclin domain-containing protein n=1 Tax=Maribacter sp. ACAM166 TaxID=2508996 RepID=UPI0010FE5209|nr:fasciclin domain-containing protein [Maribacter sp. ACAM166]TLP81316.1 fasciclin domain-containing protein [Maribacter sp. ACAM166]